MPEKEKPLWELACNMRLVQVEDEQGNTTIEVREIYTDDGIVKAWSIDIAQVWGYDEKDIERTLKSIQEAFKLPILVEKEFPNYKSPKTRELEEFAGYAELGLDPEFSTRRARRKIPGE